MSDRYEVVIGLEVHAQLLSRTKMFCACKNEYGAAPNTHICPVCSGQPGSLPVINREAIGLGIRAALALQGKIHPESIFARKNYFYPDLPKGYQISQYEHPYCTHGKLLVRLKSREEKVIRVHRAHFEEDAGKSTHTAIGTLVNLNRAGVPLIEIVSEPDMRSSEEAGQYLRTLRTLLRYTEVCDGNMEEGNFRCDANISLRPQGSPKFGTRIEIKNINSFRYVEKAIDYEIERQTAALDGGETIRQQTRLWNAAKGITEIMREKEDAHDYRYFPDPDLPILIITDEWVDSTKKKMPELPEEKHSRFISQLSLSPYDASVLTSSRELADFFESVVKESKNPKLSANWVMNELLGRLNSLEMEIDKSRVAPKELGNLIVRIDSGEISGKIAKTVFDEMFATGKDPGTVIVEKGLAQVSDTSKLSSIIQAVIAKNPDQTAQYKAGKIKLLAYFVGQVMKETKGQANPSILSELIKEELKS